MTGGLKVRNIEAPYTNDNLATNEQQELTTQTYWRVANHKVLHV